MSGRTLAAYYQTIWEMSFFHHYSIDELESLPVFELEYYRDLISDHLIKEREKAIVSG